MTDRDCIDAMIQSAVGDCPPYWSIVIADHLIANGVTIQRWIPVTERLPENDRQRVLAVCIGDYPIGYPKIDTDRYVRQHWVRYGNDVTHWMPLPEPPIEEQNRASEGENDG